MKQVTQNFRTGILKVDEVPTSSLRDPGLLVANHVSLISPGTEKSTVHVAQKSLLGKALDGLKWHERSSALFRRMDYLKRSSESSNGSIRRQLSDTAVPALC